MLYIVHSEASLPNILMEDFLCLRNSSTELQILVDSQTWFEVLKNVGCINPKTILHRLDSKTISVPKLYTPSTLNIDLILWHTHWIVCAVKLITHDLIHDFHFTF